MIQMGWMPTWACNFYGKTSNTNCPYCHLGYRDGQLVVEGEVQPGTKGQCDPADIANFLIRNANMVGRCVTLSGGEPLATRNIDHVFAAIIPHGFTWGVTSNTVLHNRIDQLSTAIGGFGSCASWTASYHPFANKDAEYEFGVAMLRERGCRYVYSNFVANNETLADVDRIVGFLSRLGFNRIHAMVDVSQPVSPELLQSLPSKLPPGSIVVGSGVTIEGATCNKNDRWMVIGPNGVLYECLTKSLRGIDPVGHVRDVFLETLPRRVEWCGLKCSAACDHEKHVR